MGREFFSTTIDPDILKLAKHRAIDLDLRVNTYIEQPIKQDHGMVSALVPVIEEAPPIRNNKIRGGYQKGVIHHGK